MRSFEKVSGHQFLTDTAGTVFQEAKYDDIKLPVRATRGSAGYDIFSPSAFVLEPGQEIKVPTGLRAHMNPGEVLMIFPRSGLGFKYYARLANTVGVVDEDYVESDNEGHIFVKVRNEGQKEMVVTAGQGFVQAIFMPFLLVDGDSTERGAQRNGGQGSTDK